MLRTKFQRLLFAILPTVILAAGCDAGDEGSENEPRQRVDASVGVDDFRAVMRATELDQAIEVADFYVYALDQGHADFQSFSDACVTDVDAHFETNCGGCICVATGGVICADFRCDEPTSKVDASGATPQTSPPGPTFDDLRGSEVPDDHPPVGPGTDFDDLFHPEPPTFPLDDHGVHQAEFHPGFLEGEGGAQLPGGYTSTPAFCDDGHAVGAVWEVGPNTCECMPQRHIACTLIGGPDGTMPLSSALN